MASKFIIINLMPTYNPYLETHSLEKYQFLHHFLPHPETKKRARLLSHKALFGYILIVAFFAGLIHLIPKFAPGVLGYASDIHIRDLLNETNQVRNEHGLQSVKVNPVLNAAAEAKARHMFENDYWAHNAPDGTTPWDFILDSGYDYKYAGENLAKNFNTSDGVVDAWYKSPSHKENLLNSNYSEIGFAVVDGVLNGYETTLVVQMFGKPRTAAPLAVNEPAVVEEQVEVEVPVAAGESSVTSEQEDLVTQEISEPSGAYSPVVDITTASIFLTISVASFLFILLVLDVWYTKKKAIPKLTGNAYAHIIFLVLTVVGLWFALVPGEVL